jgi:hypothetical protein
MPRRCDHCGGTDLVTPCLLLGKRLCAYCKIDLICLGNTLIGELMDPQRKRMDQISEDEHFLGK